LLKQRIAFTDKKIEALVYELYGLSEEEIKIVEGKVSETLKVPDTLCYISKSLLKYSF
jgi:hypothetical protein